MLDLLCRNDRIRLPHEAMPRQITVRDFVISNAASFTIGLVLAAAILLGVIR